MLNVNKNITGEAKLISPPTYIIWQNRKLCKKCQCHLFCYTERKDEEGQQQEVEVMVAAAVHFYACTYTKTSEHLFQIRVWVSLLFTTRFPKNCAPTRKQVMQCGLLVSMDNVFKTLQLSSTATVFSVMAFWISGWPTQLFLRALKVSVTAVATSNSQPTLNSATDTWRIWPKFSSTHKGNLSLQQQWNTITQWHNHDLKTTAVHLALKLKFMSVIWTGYEHPISLRSNTL